MTVSGVRFLLSLHVAISFYPGSSVGGGSVGSGSLEELEPELEGHVTSMNTDVELSAISLFAELYVAERTWFDCSVVK